MHDFFLDLKAFITLTANRIFWCHFFFSTFFGVYKRQRRDAHRPANTNSSFLASANSFVNIDNRGPGVRVPLGLTGVSITKELLFVLQF